MSTCALGAVFRVLPLMSAFSYIGTTGTEPNKAGGMIPSVSPPFGMTRWVAQTQVSYVSATPYNASWALEGGRDVGHSGLEVNSPLTGHVLQFNTRVHGFIGTRQPAIWMGESGSVSIIPGVSHQESPLKTSFEERGLTVVSSKDPDQLDDGREEVVTPAYYSVLLEDSHDGHIQCEMSASE